jgi:hypothetical protein
MRALALASAALLGLGGGLHLVSASLLASSPARPRSPACTSPDWLVCAPTTPVTLTNWTSNSLSGITLSNGLVSRSWITSATGLPAFALWDLRSSLDGPPSLSVLRTLAPEAQLVFSTASGGNVSVAAGGVVTSTGRGDGPYNFTSVANDSATECTFVAQGPTDSLHSCLSACWASSRCDIVNWIPGANASAADCVLKSCADPFNAPALSPYPTCQVWATAPAPNTGVNSVSQGPLLNRTGLDAPSALVPDPRSALLVPNGWTTGNPTARYNWTSGKRGSPPGIPFPPIGLQLVAHFSGVPGSALDGLLVDVVYEMYAGSPSIAKWVTVSLAPSAAPPSALTLQESEVERLGVSPSFSSVAPLPYPQYETPAPPLYPGSGKLDVLLDLYYAGTATWTNDDPTEGTPGSTQPLLVVAELPGLAFPLVPGGPAWTTLRVFEVFFDDGPEGGSAQPRYPSSETYYGCTLGPCTPGTGNPILGGLTERRGLTLRRFITTVAPQGLENPLQNHLTASDSASIRSSCDQMALVGWEMLVLSYGSGFDPESRDPTYIARIAADVAYCRAKNIEVGGYDLIGWTRDRAAEGWAALTPSGSDSGDACFSSGYDSYLLDDFLSFTNATGMTMFETDGPYAGYSCSNASHTGHAGESNSVAMQSRRMSAIYEAMQSAGLYTNAPDSYFMSGSSAMGIGYNEGTFRLADVELINLVQRQVIYDATYYTYPSMAWSQIPLEGTYDTPVELTVFQESLLGQLAYGMAIFIYQPEGGPFLPSPQVQDLLSSWGGWFKTYRTLLAAGDFIHVARPDGQGLDIVLHARAGDAVPALFAVTNPTTANITSGIAIPLHYAGFAPGQAVLAAFSGTPTPGTGQPFTLDYRGRLVIQDGDAAALQVPARGMVWATVVAA